MFTVSLPQPPFARSLMAVSCLLCATIYGHARVENISILKEFRGADAVLLVQIEKEEILSVRGAGCGTRYTATVREAFKRSIRLSSDQVVFGRHAGLVEGRQYLLFLKYIADPSAYYETIRQQHGLPEEMPADKEKTMELAKCQGMLPGLLYRTGAAWEIRLSYVAVEGIRPHMPDSIRVWSPEALQWLIYKEDLFAYLRTLR